MVHTRVVNTMCTNGDDEEIPMRSVADKRRKTSNQKIYRR